MDDIEGSGKVQQSSDIASVVEKEHTDSKAPLAMMQSTSEQETNSKVAKWLDGRNGIKIEKRNMSTQTIDAEEGPGLRTMNRTLSKEKQDLEKLLTNLETTNAVLKDRLVDKENSVFQLGKEIRRQNTRVKELETHLQEFENMIAKWEQAKISDKTDADHERANLKKAVDLLQKGQRNKHQLLANSEKKCVLLQVRVKALERLNGDLEEGMKLHAKAVEDGNRTFDCINEVREHQVKQDLELLMLYDELEEHLAVSAPEYEHPTSALTPYEPQTLGDFVQALSESHRGTPASLVNTPMSTLINLTGLAGYPALPQYGAAAANLSLKDSRVILPKARQSTGLRHTMSTMKPYLLAKSRAQTIPGPLLSARAEVDLLDSGHPNMSRGRYAKGPWPIDASEYQFSSKSSSDIVDPVAGSSDSSSSRLVSHSPEARKRRHVSGRRASTPAYFKPWSSSSSPDSSISEGVRLSRGSSPAYFAFDQPHLELSKATDCLARKSTSSFDKPRVHSEDLEVRSDQRRTPDCTPMRKSSEAISSSVSYHDTRNARRRSSALVLSPSAISRPKHEQPSSPSAEGDQDTTLIGSSASASRSASNSCSSVKILSSQNLGHDTQLQNKLPALISVTATKTFSTSPVEHHQTSPSRPVVKYGIPDPVEDALEFLEIEDRLTVKEYLKTLLRKNRKLQSQVRKLKCTISDLKQDAENKLLNTGLEQETLKVTPSDLKQGNSAVESNNLPGFRESSTSEQNAKYRPVAKVESATEGILEDGPTSRDGFETVVDGKIKGEINGEIDTQLSPASSQAHSLSTTMMDRFDLNYFFGFLAESNETKARETVVSPKAPPTPLETPPEKPKSWMGVFEPPMQVIYKYYNTISNSNNTTTTANHNSDNRTNTTNTYHSADNRNNTTNTYNTTHITQMTASPNERWNLGTMGWVIGVCFLALCLTLVGYMLDYIPMKSQSVVGSDIAKVPPMVLHSSSEYAGEEEKTNPSKTETARLMYSSPNGLYALLPSWMLRPQNETVFSTAVESVNFFTVEETEKVVTETQRITVPDIRYETSIYTKSEQVIVPEIRKEIFTLTETQHVIITDMQQETITLTEEKRIPEIETHHKTVTVTETKHVAVPQVETYTITRLDYITLTLTASTSSCSPCTPCDTSYRTTPTQRRPDLTSSPPSSSSPDLTGGDSTELGSPDTPPPSLRSLRNLGSFGSLPSIASNPMGSYLIIKPFAGFFDFVFPTKTKAPCTCTPAPPPPCAPSGSDASSTRPHPNPYPHPDLWPERSTNSLRREPRIDATAKYRARPKAPGSENRTLADILPAWAVTDPNRFAHVGPSHLGFAPWLQRLVDIFRFEVEEWARRSM